MGGTTSKAIFEFTNCSHCHRAAEFKDQLLWLTLNCDGPQSRLLPHDSEDCLRYICCVEVLGAAGPFGFRGV